MDRHDVSSVHPTAMDPRPDPDELDALCAAYVLDTLDDDSRTRVETWAADDPALAARLRRLGETVVARLTVVDDLPAGPPPLALLDRTRAARRPGRSLLSPDAPASLAEAHARCADAMATLVASLDDGDWAAPTRFGRPVRDVVAHLVAQLERTAAELGAGTFAVADDDYDHWRSTEPFVARYATGDTAPLVVALADVNARLVASWHVAVGDPRDLSTPSARALGRVFELWMHADDVRLAIGRAVEVPDAATLLTMCTLAADALPITMMLSGLGHSGAVARLVLTGVGGGVWLTPLAPGDTVSPDAVGDVTIVAEAHAFCRLFHRQVDAADVVRAIEGDAALARDVFAAAGALAEAT